ncbi:hypothetical protein [Limoniibacter endophyticus]|uniref:Uncharacterized protein n=1 Tax=Limoniibacter endophyticus TaxID=1565040 RepID=A0A8J3GHE5_9HYPH|nr:hypothetical protein [Limoniibacter endophyticus]GHC78519.1 hypothetical protein GCM10010136_30630 [Limoniibacter endophyticus]
MGLFADKVSALRQITEAAIPENLRFVCIFLSISDGAERARTVHACGTGFETVWRQVLDNAAVVMERHKLRGNWLRVDWVNGFEQVTFQDLRRHLGQTKRNYFRHGLSLDPGFEHAFLSEELNANGMLDGGNRIDHAVINEKNFSVYALKRFGPNFRADYSDDKTVVIFSTAGFFSDEEERVYELNPSGVDGGRRRVNKLSPNTTNALIHAGSNYLARQVGEDGRFIYGMHPCFDRPIKTYNTLRHASSTYAMIEAWEVTRSADLKAAIERSLAFIRGELIQNNTLPDGSEASFLVESNHEIKLGGNAVTILALVQYAHATGDRSDLPLLERLANGIRHMQDPIIGSFIHVLDAANLSVRAPFRTIYYDGEAAFALMRLYGLTGDPRWLETVELAFEHFLRENYWQHHDHWLGYCVNELTRYRPKEKYFRFGIRNVADHLQFVATRITTFPTLLELMMAASDMLARLAEKPELRHLLLEIDLEEFKDALQFRAHYLLNGHFYPEQAMFFRSPKKIAGSFFIRHHGFRVRIDDVEHYLSGFVAYLKHLRDDPFSQLSVRKKQPPS